MSSEEEKQRKFANSKLKERISKREGQGRSNAGRSGERKPTNRGLPKSI